MSSSGNIASGLVTWDPYSVRPVNTHASLHWHKQGMVIQNTMLLSLSVPVTFISSFWVALCGFQTEELCLLHFRRVIGMGESHADLRLLQLIQTFD